MENMTELIRVRVTPTEKERVFAEAASKDLHASDFMRNLISQYFYVPTEEENEKNAFIEKVKALRTLTGAGMIDCKRALMEHNGNVEKAISHLKNKSIVRRCINVKPTEERPVYMPEKIQFHFTGKEIEILSAYNGDLKLTDEDLNKTQHATLSLVDIKYDGTPDNTVLWIEVITPIKPSRRAIYDNIVAYIDNLLKLHKSENYKVSDENKWFNPLIACQEIEAKLYEIILHYEEQSVVAPKIVTSYMDKIDNIHNEIFGGRM